MFGKRLRELRIDSGYSMDKLIELYNAKYDAKMNKSTLSRYENNLQVPIFKVVMNFADFFNVSVDYISGFDDKTELAQDNKNNSNTFGDITNIEMNMLYNYRKLNTLGKAKADEYITDLSEQDKYTAADERPTNSISEEVKPIFKQAAAQSKTAITQK